MTVADRHPGEKALWNREGKRPIDVCYGVDGKKFIDFFINRIRMK